MRLLFLAGLTCLATLAVACLGNGDQESVSPTAAPDISPTAVATGSPLSSDDVIAKVQEYQALEKAQGVPTVILVPLASRLAKLCQDSPKWSTEEQQGIWRVFAECIKQEGIPAEEDPLHFTWLFYPDTGSVMPVSNAAHVAQYSDPWR